MCGQRENEEAGRQTCWLYIFFRRKCDAYSEKLYKKNNLMSPNLLLAKDGTQRVMKQLRKL